MAIKDFAAGPISVEDVRRELGALAPQSATSVPRFWIRTPLHGPAYLNMLSLDLTLLVTAAKPLTNGALMVPIPEPLSPGQRLGWTFWSAFDLPQVAAYLQINNRIIKLSQKNGLAAGGIWAKGIILQAKHLGPQE